jgi:YHS domain-containing protein
MLSAKHMMPRLSFSAVLVVMLTLALCCSVSAGGGVNTGYFGGVAIKGYDPVAYFAESRAVKGSPDFSHAFLGETWYFANAANRDAFASSPVKYAPQYGGHCAGEMYDADRVGTGVTMNIDPEAWRIIDGKLYLFYRKSGAKWFEQNRDKTVARADTNWQKVKDRLAAQ